MSAVAERVERSLVSLVNEKGFDLEAVEVQPAGHRRLVRVLVDGDGGVTLDQIAELTPLLSEQLDESEAMGDQPYVLEVSSPGVERPLTQPRHWRRNRGRLVRVTTDSGELLIGRVGASDDDAVTLEPADDESLPVTRTVPLVEVHDAHVEVEFGQRAAGEG
jgi:ribosome maturation factor RimP